MQQLLDTANEWLWGALLLTLLLGAGIFLTFQSGFLQLRLRRVWKATFGALFHGAKRTPEEKARGISPTQAVMTALAGTIGTGNIVGVATALATGGAGAIFWMWISAFFGMMTKYSEIVLAVRYRERGPDGRWRGGPMYYIEKGLHKPWLARVFAVLCALCAFGIGNMTQMQAAAEALEGSFGVAPLAAGVAVAAVCGVVVIGGRQRIAQTNAKLVPLMGAFYVVGALICLGARFDRLGAAFGEIFTAAFTPTAAFGGLAGFSVAQAIRFGVARGLFTNEAGLGSAPIAHASAEVESAHKQGMWGIAEVFLDTIVMCTLTALVILTADGALWRGGQGGFALTAAAFSETLGGFAGGFLSVAMVFFAAAAILGWAFYGQSAVEYLSRGRRGAVRVYQALFLCAIVVGAAAPLQTVWGVADLLNGLMVIPNTAAVLLLYKKVFGPEAASAPPAAKRDGGRALRDDAAKAGRH